MNCHSIIGMLFSLTALVSYVNYKYIKLPKSIGITLVTLFLMLILTIGKYLNKEIEIFINNFLLNINFDYTFLHGMLSFLLFAGALHINVMDLKKQKLIIISLATISVIISTTIIAYLTYILTKYFDINLSFSTCLIFGALISPTDPIAVLGILKIIKVPKTLELKITGEALFNDAMAVVLFFIACSLTYNNTKNIFFNLDIIIFFLQQSLGGIFLGLILGLICSKFLKNIDDYEIAIIITLSIVTGGYTLSHEIQTCGPIVMVISGLIIGNSIKKGNMNKETQIRFYSFWELLDEILNTILFVLIGIEFIEISFNYKIFILSILIILITLLSRWISVIIPITMLSNFKKFKHDTIIVMTWGGLRGGISIALALSIKDIYNYNIIITITYFVVIFSIIIQGLTIKPLLEYILIKQKNIKKNTP